MDSSFFPETPASPVPVYPYATAKRAYARLGLVYFLFFLIVQLSALLLFAILSAFPVSDAPWFSMALSGVCLYGIGLPALLLMLRGLPVLPPPRGKMGFGAFLVSAVMVLGLGFATNFAAQFLFNLLGQLGFPTVENNLEQVLSGNSLLLTAFFTVVLAPLGEEFIFRKLICDRTAAYGEWQAICLSALFFMAFHASLNQAPYTLVIGGFLAFLYIRTGRLLYPILLHAVFNFFGTVPGMLLSKYADLDGIFETLSDGELSELSWEMLRPLLLYGLYAFMIFGLAIVGVILFFTKLGKMRASMLPTPMPAGHRFSIVCGNAGFWLFMGFSFLLIFLSFLSSYLEAIL